MSISFEVEVQPSYHVNPEWIVATMTAIIRRRGEWFNISWIRDYRYKISLHNVTPTVALQIWIMHGCFEEIFHDRGHRYPVHTQTGSMLYFGTSDLSVHVLENSYRTQQFNNILIQQDV